MESNNSYENLWADLWENGNVKTRLVAAGTKRSRRVVAKAKSKKLSAKLSITMKKVKGGASLGLHWIKHKYHKTNHKTKRAYWYICTLWRKKKAFLCSVLCALLNSQNEIKKKKKTHKEKEVNLISFLGVLYMGACSRIWYRYPTYIY